MNSMRSLVKESFRLRCKRRGDSALTSRFQIVCSQRTGLIYPQASRIYAGVMVGSGVAGFVLTSLGLAR